MSLKFLEHLLETEHSSHISVQCGLIGLVIGLNDSSRMRFAVIDYCSGAVSFVEHLEFDVPVTYIYVNAYSSRLKIVVSEAMVCDGTTLMIVEKIVKEENGRDCFESLLKFKECFEVFLDETGTLMLFQPKNFKLCVYDLTGNRVKKLYTQTLKPKIPKLVTIESVTCIVGKDQFYVISSTWENKKNVSGKTCFFDVYPLKVEF